MSEMDENSAMVLADDGELVNDRPAAQTPAQAKVDAIAALTMSAYANASKLAMTADEVKLLQADFPDEAFRPGAAGKENLIYLEHAYIRDRMNEVFGPGAWSLIPRNRWTEEHKTSKGQPAVRVYCEVMMMVRGCFVAEAIGDMEYYPHNAGTNYGDAVEGAKSAALRRCAKELGMGLQAWKKGWTEGWWQRRERRLSGKPIDDRAVADEKTDLRATGKKLLEAAAKQGSAELKRAWGIMPKPMQAACRDIKDECKMAAEEMDREIAGLSDAAE
jgi:hypothetical protein